MERMNRLRIIIFIPTYNAAGTLPTVLDRIPESIKGEVQEILIIDNASPDNTSLVAIGYKGVKNVPNLNVIKNESNIGYGGSQKRAYQYAIEKNYDAIVMLHGDAQYAPEKIPDLLEPLRRGEADMVFGSRIAGLPLKGGMPLYKFLGNKFLTAIQNYILNMKLTEFHSGFRVFSCQALKNIPFQLCSDDFHFDTDIIIQFQLKNMRIVETPIPTYYGSERSNVNVVRYGLSVLKSTSQYWLHQRGIIRASKFSI